MEGPGHSPGDKGIDTSCLAIKQNVPYLSIATVELGHLRASLVHVVSFVVSTWCSCPVVLAVYDFPESPYC